MQKKYPEAEITTTAALDCNKTRHSKNIPEPRLAMISGFSIPVFATIRPKRENSSNMQPEANVERSRFTHFDQRRQLAATSQGPAQATFHAPSDHKRKSANRAVQLIAGRSIFRAAATVARRSGTRDAGRKASRVPSLPFFPTHHFRQPAITDGRRSTKTL